MILKQGQNGVTIKFQVVLHNVKVSKRINAIKVYLFQLLGVYLIDEPTKSTISTCEK